ncbi:flagellar protein [Helicobacter sp. 11S02596-1]|uniref:DUF7494 domain-containing protein n=1 Tax=Helicobacter sp. 11S02596-1 TaxID=1476194 RepID=UPI000BA6CAEE|nr:flagellar protein [Helicobacter sp. 11S02596-1]PAF44291.1 hypothetical protein BJI48_03690 [Helicobacter sp. 11S02596-1]
MHIAKIFLLIFFLANLAYSLEIAVNYGKENSKNFSVLNLKDSKPFLCKEKPSHADNTHIIECIIDAIPQEGFSPTRTMFFDFYYRMIDGKFHLYIEPKKKQKLFAIQGDLKKDIRLIREKPTFSRIWQIVGYEDKIPFLSHQKPRGLNFPISIPDAQTPFIAELDINNKPLEYTKGFDFDAYMRAKSQLEKKSYYEVLNTINETLKQYPNTIFKKDLYLYQIIALSKLDQKQQDTIIDIATNWIKQYPSDTSIPQVLYMLAKAYADIRYDSEAQYYYKRIIQEYPKNRYAPLAKMQLAIEFSNTSNIGLASIYFQEAYSEAKDLESASEIAINWAKFEVKKQNFTNAEDLIEKVLQAYPQFFLLNPQKTYQTIGFLEKNALYKSAANIAQYLFTHTDDKQIQEQVGYDLGNLYAKANEFDKAHQANLAYIKNYPTSPKIKEVQKRDDEILFKISGDNKEKLKRYNYIIAKYPGTKESQQALEKKAQLLIDEKQFQEVLAIRKDLGEDSVFVQTALNSLIKQYLQTKDCKNANLYLIQTTHYDLTGEQKLQAFHCLYNASLNKNAQIISKDMAKQAKSIDEKLAWLVNDAKNLYQLGDYKTSMLAAKDAFSLALASKKSQYYDVGFTLFFDLANINSKEEAFKVYSQLEKFFKDDSRMIKVYATLLNWETGMKNDTTIQIYAKNIIALQKKYKTDEFTPYAEFELINSLMRVGKAPEALTAVNSLLQKNLTNEQKQKALYTKASIQNLQNNAQGAKDSFEKCTKIPADSPWKNLCTEGLDLFKP